MKLFRKFSSGNRKSYNRSKWKSKNNKLIGKFKLINRNDRKVSNKNKRKKDSLINKNNKKNLKKNNKKRFTNDLINNINLKHVIIKSISLMIITVFLIVIATMTISAFQSTSTSYTMDTNVDSFAMSEATSTSFTNRFIGGIKAVAQYISNLFSGRFGILADTVTTEINLTSPYNNSEISRGSNSISNEDDKGVVSDVINLTANVYDISDSSGVSDATCYFYDNSVLINSATSNSSGDCVITWDKSAKDANIHHLFVNYSKTGLNQSVTQSNVNISITRYVTTLTTSPSHSGKYYDGEVATLTMAISKINATGTFDYDPLNVTANATNAAENVYTDGDKLYPGKNITRTGAGAYSANVTVDYSFGNAIKWNVWLSDDNLATYVGSAIHADIAICSNAGWGSWGSCSGGSQTRTDSSGCTESQSCEDDDDDGGTVTCFPAGTKILMADENEKNIEDVKVGDYVVSYDENKKQKTTARVLELEAPIREHMCRIVFEDNSELKLTNEHPVYTSEGWKSISPKATIRENIKLDFVSKLNTGDDVLFESEEYKEIVSIDCWKESVQTYNLKTIEKYNNFYADSILVHNKDAACTWGAWSDCIEISPGVWKQTRTSSCGAVDTKDCECVPNWECSLWDECLPESEFDPADLEGLVNLSFGGENIFETLNSFTQENNENEFDSLSLLTGLAVDDTIKISNSEDVPWFKKLIGSVLRITGFAVGDNSATCKNEGDVGNIRCRGRRVQECIKRGRRYRWKTIKTCSRGKVCEGDGECVCKAGCNIGDTRCKRGRVQECQNVNGCGKWQRGKRCSGRSTCINGKCECNKEKRGYCDIEDEVKKSCDGRKILECQRDSRSGCGRLRTIERCSRKEVCDPDLFECVMKHCEDNVQNFDEEDVDCGGADCEQCGPICGDGNIEEGEACDSDTVDCIIDGYSGTQSCKNDCTDYEDCETSESCGDSILNGNEQCDDGNNVDGDGCDSNCNDEQEDLETDQYAIGAGETKQVTINKGDKLSVTYEEKKDEKAVMTIKKITTADSTSETETHTVRVDEITEEKVTVTVTSTPVTEDISLGAEEIFEFAQTGDVVEGEEGNYFQKCLAWEDESECGTDEGKPETEIRQCIVDLTITFLPEDNVLKFANGTEVEFKAIITGAVDRTFEVNWYLNSEFKKSESEPGDFESSFTQTFEEDSSVRVHVSENDFSREETWQITIDNDLDPECVPDWECRYTPCDESGYKYVIAGTCEDVNECGTDEGKPDREECDCIPEYECEDWEECKVDYDIHNIFHYEPLIKGTEYRTCVETTNCELEEDEIIERRECSLVLPIRLARAEWCFEQYIEIYDASTDELVSRIKESSVQGISKLDIAFTITEFKGYCSYCFDGVKNFDEEEVDCGGPGCPACVDKGTYTNYLYYVKLSLWWLLALLIVFFIIKNRDKVKRIVPAFRKTRFREPKVRRTRFRWPRFGLPRFKQRPVRPAKPHVPLSYRLGNMFRRIRMPMIDIRIRIGRARAKRRQVREIRRVERARRPSFFSTLFARRPKPRIPVARPVKPKKVRRPLPLADLRRRLGEWKRAGFSNTARIEADLKYKLARFERGRKLRRAEKVHAKDLRRQQIQRDRYRRQAEKQRLREQRIREREYERRERQRLRQQRAIENQYRAANRRRKLKRFWISIFGTQSSRRDKRQQKIAERNRLRKQRLRQRQIIREQEKRQREQIRRERQRIKQERIRQRKIRAEQKRFRRSERGRKVKNLFANIFKKLKRPKKIKPEYKPVKPKPKVKLKRRAGIFSSIFKVRRIKPKPEKKIQKQIVKHKKKVERKIKKVKKKEIKKQKKVVKREAKVIKKKIKKKQVLKKDLPDLRRKLNQWQKQGYYNPSKLHKKLDKYEGYI